MAIEFYWTAGGPFAQRCLMAFAIKDLPFSSRKLDIAKGENRTPELLAMSPAGMLPILKDGPAVVRESFAIVYYLDRAYPKPSLFGETPVAAGRIMQEICEQQSYAEPYLLPLLRSLFGGKAPQEDLTKAISGIQKLLEEIDGRLTVTGWLAGDAVSAADINLYPLLGSALKFFASDRAKELSLKAPDVAAFPHLEGWTERLRPFAERFR